MPHLGGTRIARLFGRAILAALVLLQIVPLTVAARAATVGGIVQTARFASSLDPNRRHLDLDPSARTLLEIGQPAGKPGMRVTARDVSSLKSLKSLDIPDAIGGAGGFLSTVDELHHRLFVLYPVRPADNAAVRGVLGTPGTGPSAGVVAENTRTIFGVAAVDTMRMRLVGSGTLALLQPSSPQDRAQGNAIGIKALSYYRDGDRDVLYLVSEPPVGIGNLVVSTHAVVLHQVDVAKLLDPSAGSAVDWSYPVAQCSLTMARDTPSIVFRSPSAPVVTIPCRQGGAQGLVAGQPGETPGVVQVHINPDLAKFSAAFYPVSGNLQYGVVALDPLSERLLIQIDGSTTEAGIWVFDIRSAAFIGLVGLPASYANGGTTALAIDVARGRMYAISSPDPATLTTGVLVASTDSDGADQGVIATVRPSPLPVKRVSVVDPLSHRIIVPTEEGAIVLEDHVPLRPADRPVNADAATTDVSEGARTNANFVGGTQAYGARIRWVGGLRGAQRNANTVVEGQNSDLNPNTGGITPPPPSEGTRDLHLARVSQMTLTNGEASAKASGAERDLENTDADLGGFATYVRRWGGPDLADQRWPYPTVQCVDFGNAKDNRGQKANGATVVCDAARKKVSALAVDDSFSRGGVVRIAESRARSAVARDPRRGVVAVAEAEAFGIDFGGVAGIGRVASRAETWATGRPKSSNRIGAGSSFTRTIEHAWVVRGGAREEICALSCDPLAVRDAFNAALGLRARVDVPLPEPSRQKGSPGGYESLIVRDPFERANESAVNEEADDRRLEVPGLVVTVFADGRVPSRVVISLAGVSAESHYGIFLVAQPVAFRPPYVAHRVGGTRGGSGGGLGNGSGSDGANSGSAGGGGFVPDFFRKIVSGVRFAFASPARAIRAASLLLFFAGPLVLWSRRRRGAATALGRRQTASALRRRQP